MQKSTTIIGTLEMLENGFIYVDRVCQEKCVSFGARRYACSMAIENRVRFIALHGLDFEIF